MIIANVVTCISMRPSYKAPRRLLNSFEVSFFLSIIFAACYGGLMVVYNTVFGGGSLNTPAPTSDIVERAALFLYVLLYAIGYAASAAIASFYVVLPLGYLQIRSLSIFSVQSNKSAEPKMADF
jgi:hypothetical protein